MEISQLGEIKTIECYYHNVAEYKEGDQDAWFGLGHGYKKMWIECDAIVKYGFDTSGIKPKKIAENKYEIKMPKIKVTDVEVIPESITKPIEDKKFWSDDITAEDQSQAMKVAEDEIENTAKNDTTLLKQAENRGKRILEAHIKKIDENYQIEWK